MTPLAWTIVGILVVASTAAPFVMIAIARRASQTGGDAGTRVSGVGSEGPRRTDQPMTVTRPSVRPER